MEACELSVSFIIRRPRCGSQDPGKHVFILPPQMIKRHRLENGAVVLVSEIQKNRTACVTLHNSVDYGLDYTFLKPPKALVSEELLMSLGVEANVIVPLRMIPLGDVAVARGMTLSYLEHYDTREGKWQSLSAPVDMPSSGYGEIREQDRVPMGYTGNSCGIDQIYPLGRWWYWLLRGEMNATVISSLLGSVLGTGNVVSLNLRGVMARFKVEELDVAGQADEGGETLAQINETTQVKVKLVDQEDASVKPEETETKKLGGLHEPMNILRRYVVYPLLFAETYAKLGLYPPTGVLLHGPPGCGKTMIAKSMQEGLCAMFGLKQELPVHVKLVQSSDLLSSVVGKTEENIAALFNECATIAKTMPCICFIDEIDALCRKREGSTASNARKVNVFLNQMDGVGPKRCGGTNRRRYVIIGATNDVDTIDPALRRPGRFGMELEIGVPNSAERLDILKSMLEDITHSLSESDIRHINDYCQAFVGADLKQLVATASWNRLNKLDKGRFSDDTMPEEIVMDSSTPRSLGEDEGHCVTLADFEEALKTTCPSALRELHLQIPDVKWDDIGGYEEAKLLLKECVEYPRIYANAYEKMNIQIPRGILLYGPPGCSKTLMAKAVATETHMNFISVKGPELFSKWVGESERAIRELFRKARINSPCVIFFDEVDSISVSREMSDAGGVGNRVLSQLLNEMDGINSMKQVLVIGATNRPDLIDSALLRPGRFDRLVYIPLPDMEARKRIFMIHLKRMPTDGFDIEQTSHELANSTDGYSGAEIAMICREGGMAALRELVNRDRVVDNRNVSDQVTIEEYTPLEDQFSRLTLNDIALVSVRHLRDAIQRIKPRTKSEAIQFYEEYRHSH